MERDDDATRWMQYRTAWHPMLVVLLTQTRLPGWTLTPEFLLSREPGRVDVVLVRADDTPRMIAAPTHLRTLWSGLSPHTLLHFKGPSDELERADVAQLLAYACQYVVVADVDVTAVGLRVLAPQVTPRFVDELRRFGGALSETDAAGVHEGALGVFPLRVVESQEAFVHEGEHLLYAFTPKYVQSPQSIPELDRAERQVFYALCQCVAQFRNDPRWRAIMKDAAQIEEAFDDSLEKFLDLLPVERRLGKVPLEQRLASLTLEQRLTGLTPEQRLAGLAPEQRLTGLTPEQRLAGLAPEQRLAGLAPEQRLAGLAPEQRLAGLAPERRLADIDPVHQILALSDEALRGMPDSYLVTLPEDVQERLRTRIGRPPRAG